MAPPKKISPAEQEAEPQAHSEEEKENLTEEESDELEDEEEEEEDFEPDMIIRAKWCIDGAETLDQVVEHLQDFIRYVQGLKTQGYELRDPVQDDYGFLYKKDSE